MELLNYHNTIPYSSKYWEDNPLFSRWFIMGKGDLVLVEDPHDSIFLSIPLEHAKRLCEARNRYVDELEKINEELGGNRRVFNN